jgi:hypothetical protein
VQKYRQAVANGTERGPRRGTRGGKMVVPRHGEEASCGARTFLRNEANVRESGAVSMLLTRHQSRLFVRGECAEMSDLAGAPVTRCTLRIHTAHTQLAAPLACAVCAVCAPCVVASMRSRLNPGVRVESQDSVRIRREWIGEPTATNEPNALSKTHGADLGQDVPGRCLAGNMSRGQSKVAIRCAKDDR